MKNFPTPHCHPKSIDTGSTPEAFAEKEIQLGTGYITVTDHGSLGATRDIYDLCKSNKKFKDKLKPILGVECYFRDDKCPHLLEAGHTQDIKTGKFTNVFKYCHMTLHCLDEQAFFALVKAMSDADKTAEAHGSERKPIFDWKTLETLGQFNITGTSGCLIGMVGRHLVQNNDPAMARTYYQRIRSIFKPGNFYVEVFPHKCDSYWKSSVVVTDTYNVETSYPTWKSLKTNSGTVKAEDLAKSQKGHVSILEVMNNRKWTPLENPIQIQTVKLTEGFLKNECTSFAPNGDVQKSVNEFVVALAEEFGDPVLVSDDSHHATADDKVVQDMRLAQLGGSWRFSNVYARMTSEQAYQYFKSEMGISEAKYEGWIENNLAWAKRFDSFVFTPRRALPDTHYPTDTLAHTISLIEKHGRMDWNNKAMVERLWQEINLLHKNGVVDLLSYFMPDEEIVSLYHANDRLTGPVRGSAGGVLLAYLLGITHIDPLRYELSLDRFLTPDRIQNGKLPDIDLDLSSRDLLVSEIEVEMLTLEDGTVVQAPVGKYTEGSDYNESN